MFPQAITCKNNKEKPTRIMAGWEDQLHDQSNKDVEWLVDVSEPSHG